MALVIINIRANQQLMNLSGVKLSVLPSHCLPRSLARIVLVCFQMGSLRLMTKTIVTRTTVINCHTFKCSSFWLAWLDLGCVQHSKSDKLGRIISCEGEVWAKDFKRHDCSYCTIWPSKSFESVKTCYNIQVSQPYIKLPVKFLKIYIVSFLRVNQLLIFNLDFN